MPLVLTLAGTALRANGGLSDLAPTVLDLLGFDHERLTFHHAGRDYRLTDVHGRVVKEILG